MKQIFTILIADRNPHVREFLKREMMADGYRVRLAENGRQLLKLVYHHDHLDLLIVDPDLPDIDVSSLLTKLQNRIPSLPVVVHTFLSDYSDHLDVLQAFPFVEKRGSSIERLKKVVFDSLQKYYSKQTQIAKERETLRRTVL